MSTRRWAAATICALALGILLVWAGLAPLKSLLLVFLLGVGIRVLDELIGRLLP